MQERLSIIERWLQRTEDELLYDADCGPEACVVGIAADTTPERAYGVETASLSIIPLTVLAQDEPSRGYAELCRQIRAHWPCLGQYGHPLGQFLIKTPYQRYADPYYWGWTDPIEANVLALGVESFQRLNRI